MESFSYKEINEAHSLNLNINNSCLKFFGIEALYYLVHQVTYSEQLSPLVRNVFYSLVWLLHQPKGLPWELNLSFVSWNYFLNKFFTSEDKFEIFNSQGLFNSGLYCGGHSVFPDSQYDLFIFNHLSDAIEDLFYASSSIFIEKLK